MRAHVPSPLSRAGGLGDWFPDTPEARAMLAEERADGVRATIVSTHLQGSGMFPHPRISVLPDDRRRSEGSIVWECSEVTKLPNATSCPACGGRHGIFYCPERV